MKTIYLIACVAKKKNLSAPAKTLYQSPWFRKAIDYCQRNSGTETETYILSAKHGLLRLEQEVEPYNATLKAFTAQERGIWAAKVLLQISRAFGGHKCRFILLAGEKYREFLIPTLEREGHEVLVPMQHLGIGQQLAWLNRQNRTDDGSNNDNG